MDHTPIEDLLTDLETIDPAEAADVADEVAGRLSDELDDAEGAGTAPQA
jgi:hypothetical protein